MAQVQPNPQADTHQQNQQSMEVKAFAHPDDTRTFDKARLELITLHGRTVGRLTLEPGWKWSTHLKPVVKTASCEAPHFQYHVSGTLHIKMDDGTERDVKAGEVSSLPTGHDAWVVGNEPVVLVDFQGLVDYGKKLPT